MNAQNLILSPSSLSRLSALAERCPGGRVRLLLSVGLGVLTLGLVGCGGTPVRVAADTPAPQTTPAPTPAPAVKKPVRPPASYALKKGGGFYKDDGPGENPPEDLDNVPDAVPRFEPLHRFANNPYSVLGRDYVPLKNNAGFRQEGIASWYGRKFHGQKTSSGEAYDMYGMTAAHPTLPIPSYVRVSNPANGAAVVLRVNDRGPFHADRVMDLSFTAAWKLGLVDNGSGYVVVEAVQPGETLPPVATLPASPSPAPAAATSLATLQSTRKNPPKVSAEPDPAGAYAAPRRESAAPAATVAAVAADAAAPSPAPQLAAAAPVAGTFIQLGAFGSPENAESFRTHMGRELDWLADKLRIEVAGKLHRVQIGPFASRNEAEAAVGRITSVLGSRPTIVVR